jgi:hypothetical protein
MSELAERAIVFYLEHPEVVDEVKATHGRNYRVYDCPECSTSVILQDEEMVSISSQPSVVAQEKLNVDQVEEAKADPEERNSWFPVRDEK